MTLVINNLRLPQLCWLIKLNMLIQMATMSKGEETQFLASEEKKSHTCKTCGFSTMKIEKLKSHFLVHSGEKPFTCEQCQYSFKRAGNLKQHMSTHSEERLFNWQQCNKDFKTAGDLKQHLVIHSETKPLRVTSATFLPRELPTSINTSKFIRA